MENCVGTIIVKSERTDERDETVERESSDNVPPVLEIKLESSPMALKCSVCNLLFSNEDSLNRHQSEHDMMAKCTVCGVAFSKPSRLNDHFLYEHTEFECGNLYCVACEKEFDTEGKLQLHVSKQHTHVYKHQCGECTKSFPDPRDLEAHENWHLGLKPKQCEICCKSFANQRRLDAHLETHSGVKFKCTFCDRSYTRKTKLTSHMKVHTNPSAYQCAECNKTLSSKCSLSEHMKIHTSFKCKVCGEEFKKRLQLQYHSLAHQGISSFRCTLCNSSFAAMYELKKHMRTHTSSRDFECNICQKKYSNSKSLKAHIRRHTGELQYPCKYCDYRFNTSSELKSHTFIHTRESDFQCSICARKLPTSTRLKLHMESHAGIKRFQCDICLKYFTQKTNLIDHIKVIHGPPQLIKCYQCDQSFKSARSLRKHNKRKHSQVPMNGLTKKGEPKKAISEASYVMENVKKHNCSQQFKSREVNPKVPKVKKARGHSTTPAHSKPRDLTTTVLKPAEKRDKDTVVSPTQNRTNENSAKLLKSKKPVSKYKTNGITVENNKAGIKCDYCVKIFPNRDALTGHLRSYHPGPSKYRCELCDRAFRYQSTLNSHLNNHPQARLFDCHFCERVFDDATALRTHVANHTELILKQSAELSSLQVHSESANQIDTVHNESTNEIDTVHRESTNQIDAHTTNLPTHDTELLHFSSVLKSESSCNPSSAVFCTTNQSDFDYQTDSEQSMCQGYSLTELARLYADPVDLPPTGDPPAGQSGSIDFDSLPTAIEKSPPKRKRIVQPKNPSPKKKDYTFQCDICERVLSSSLMLARHRKTHSTVRDNPVKRKILTKQDSSKSYKHPKLDRSNSSGSNYVNNSNIQESKPHACKMCKRRYVSARGLKKHMKSHSVNVTGLNDVAKDSKETRFACDMCPKSYATKQGLLKHSKSHITPDELEVQEENSRVSSGVDDEPNCETTHIPAGSLDIDKTLQCKICEKSFPSENALKLHATSHVFVKAPNMVMIV